MDPRLSIVTVGVSDVDRSVEFYHDGLGFPVRDREDGDPIAFFPLEGTWLAAYGREDLAEDATVPNDGQGFDGVTLAQTVASPEAVDETLRAAADVGGTVVKPGQEVFWGGYSGYFADPDGHLWEIAWNPEFD